MGIGQRLHQSQRTKNSITREIREVVTIAVFHNRGKGVDRVNSLCVLCILDGVGGCERVGEVKVNSLCGP